MNMEQEECVEEQEEEEENNKTQSAMIKIASIPEDDGNDDSLSLSINDRMIAINKVNKVNKVNNRINKELTIDSAVVDTTNAFLELLQLDTMSKHLQEMRDRRMFLEKAANDQDLPEEERQIAAWITDTYLSKSPTMNYPQSILENIMKKQQQTTNINTNININIKQEEEEEEILDNKLNKQTLSDIICRIDVNLNTDIITNLLSQINEWNFPVFQFVELCGNSSLALLMITICRSQQIISKLNIGIIDLINYMNLIDINYKNNPYHNHIHAADVLLNMYYFMKSSLFQSSISILDCFSILISASIHDVGHPGHGNSFEINIESQLAITYNDQSVLENMHIALAWNLLKKQNSNILCKFNKNDKRRFRRVLIESVLATDMSQHSLHSETLEKLVEEYSDNDAIMIDNKFSDQFLPIALHTADLGNLCKDTIFYNEWVDRLMNEFFNQGDKERELQITPISFLCDRQIVNIHSGQVGFINFVIRPWFIKFGRLLSEDSHNKLFLNLLNENLKYMQKRANQTKDAQEEIKKKQHLIITTKEEKEEKEEKEDEEEEEEDDTIKPLPSSSIIKQPVIAPLPDETGINIINSRTSKSYSIVAMSFPEMRSKLLEYADKEKHNESINQ